MYEVKSFISFRCRASQSRGGSNTELLNLKRAELIGKTQTDLKRTTTVSNSCFHVGFTKNNPASTVNRPGRKDETIGL